MDFETQVKFFTEQITELLEEARFQAGLDFSSDKANWEQTERVYKADIAELQGDCMRLQHALNQAEEKYQMLQSKISALV